MHKRGKAPKYENLYKNKHLEKQKQHRMQQVPSFLNNKQKTNLKPSHN